MLPGDDSYLFLFDSRRCGVPDLKEDPFDNSEDPEILKSLDLTTESFFKDPTFNRLLRDIILD